MVAVPSAGGSGMGLTQSALTNARAAHKMKRINSAAGFMKATFSKNMRLAADGQKKVTLAKNKYGNTIVEKSPERSPVR
jgi:hypothetical protein